MSNLNTPDDLPSRPAGLPFEALTDTLLLAGGWQGDRPIAPTSEDLANPGVGRERHLLWGLAAGGGGPGRDCRYGRMTARRVPPSGGCAISGAISERTVSLAVDLPRLL